jgi:hypothetical protein
MSETYVKEINNFKNPLFHHDISGGFGTKFNRTLTDTVPMFMQYSFLFDNHWNFKTGLSYNIAASAVNGYHFDFSHNNLFINGIDIGLKFNNYSYALYKKGYNSIIPYFIIDKGFYFKLGIAFHFFNPYSEYIHNIFYYSPLGFETALYYAIGWHFKNIGDIYSLKIEINNHDRFYPGTNAYIGLMLKNTLKIYSNIKIFCDLELRMSGSIALAANFYVFGIYSGVTINIDH